MFCAYCGKELPSNVVFCPYCGKKSVISKEDNNVQLVEPTYQGQDTANNCNKNTRNVTINSALTGTANYNNIESNPNSISEKDDPTYAKVFSRTGLFDYRGRRSRSDYFNLEFTAAIINHTLKKVPVVNIIVLIILTYIKFTNASKRFHDINKSAAWTVVLVVLDTVASMFFEFGNSLVSMGESFNTVMTTYVITIAIIFIPRIYLICKKGTDGPNQYGPDPLAIEEK